MSNLPAQTLLTELKGKDYDRYILCLFGTAEHRDDLAALFLFNAELALVRAQVSEPLLGQIRMQWWRDSLKNLTAGIHPSHPVLDRFAVLIRRGIDLTPLQTIIDAREHELLATPSPDNAADHHSTDTISHALAQFAASIIGQQSATEDFLSAFSSYAEVSPIHPVLAGNSVTQQKEKIRTLREKIKTMPHAFRHTCAPLLMHNDLAYFYITGRHRGAPKSRLWRLTYLLWRGVRVY